MNEKLYPQFRGHYVPIKQFNGICTKLTFTPLLKIHELIVFC